MGMLLALTRQRPRAVLLTSDGATRQSTLATA
jgi:hypothetical protein